MKNMKGKLYKMAILTRHGKKRLVERAGVTKKKAKKLADRVYRIGIVHSETRGELHKFISTIYFKQRTANNIKFWNDKVYLFRNNVLITAYSVPQSIMNNLQDNLSPEAYLFIKNIKNSDKHMKEKFSQRSNYHKRKLDQNKVSDEDNKTYIDIIDSISKVHNKTILVTRVTKVTPTKIHVHYTSDNPFNDENQFSDIQNDFYEQTGRKLHIQHIKNLQGGYATIADLPKDRWKG